MTYPWRSDARGLARRVVVVIVAAVGGGCYSAISVSGEALHPGARVYVDLTESGTTALARYVGPNVRQVYGDVSARSDTEIVLSLRSVTDRRSIETLWSGERVPVLPREIAEIRERRFSKQKSWLFGSGLAAALVLTGRAFGVLGGGEAHRGDVPVGQ
jgi:hypothetical protein